jgi:hypothetical protein
LPLHLQPPVGGPILNSQNEVIGIAVKGQGIPKRFADDDEMSRFVPISRRYEISGWRHSWFSENSS